MKTKFQKLFTTLLISLMTMICLGCAAGAARETIYLHTFTKGPKDTSSPGYMQSDYSVIKCKVNSNSNPSVVKTEVERFAKNWDMMKFTAKKRGTSKVKYTYTLNGKKVTWYATVKVRKYVNPLQLFKIGKLNFTKRFNENSYFASTRKSVKGKFTIKLKKGWKIRNGFYCSTGMSRSKKLKNGTYVSLSDAGHLWMNLYNPTKDDEITVHFSL